MSINVLEKVLEVEMEDHIWEEIKSQSTASARLSTYHLDSLNCDNHGSKALTGLDRESAHLLQLHAVKLLYSCKPSCNRSSKAIAYS